MGAAERKTEAFFSSYTKRSYKKGAVILRAGEVPSGVLYLTKGLVRQYALSEKGEVLILHVFRPSSFFPMTWVINNTPNHYYYEAVVASEIRRAPKEDVQKFLKEHPDIMYRFASRLLDGVTGLLRRVEQLVLEDAYTKTVSLLDYCARTFGEKEKNGHISVRLTHREIAAWIGTTRETASLQMEELAKKKIISYHKRRIVVTDPSIFARELQDAAGRRT